MFNFITSYFRRTQENGNLNQVSTDDSGQNIRFAKNRLASSSNSKITNKLANKITQEDLPMLVDEFSFELDEAQLTPSIASKTTGNNANNLTNSLTNNLTNNSTNSSLNNRLAKTSAPTTPANPSARSARSARSASTLISNTNDKNSLENLNKDSVFHLDSQINPFAVSNDVLGLIDEQTTSKFQILPIDKNEQTKTVTILFANKLLRQKAEQQLKNISSLQSYTIDWQEFDVTTLETLIHSYYFKGDKFEEKATKVVNEKISQVKEEFRAKEKPLLTFDYSGEVTGEQNNTVRDIIANMVCRADEKGATDINFVNNLCLMPDGTTKSELVVSARIDGVMQEIHRVDMQRKAYDAIPLVAKTLSGLNSVRHGDRDTGIIKTTLAYGKKVEPAQLRVQFIPAGEERGIGVCMRIQKPYHFDFSLENIGLSEEQIKLIQRYVIEAVHGCTFISGSMNRGKNCTLVTILKAIQNFNKLQKTDKHIGLIEDAQEFVLDGISQLAIAKNTSFIDIEEALLRYNLDVIAVGETRNSDGATMVTDLAIIGHPMLTTIHCDTACDVPYRLINLGIPRYKIAESLNVLISQTLVRKSCPACVKEKDFIGHISGSELSAHLEKIGMPKDIVFLRSTGKTQTGATCQTCNGTGFKSRTGIFEVLPVSEEIKEIILRENSTSFQLRRQALKEGFQTIWHNGLMKAALGEIALSELLRCIALPTPASEGLDILESISTNDYVLDFAN